MQSPSSDQASNNDEIRWTDNNGVEHAGFAAWYPQMGGYSSKCIVELGTSEGDCFDVYVWHDGEFPFEDLDNEGQPLKPVHLHHCEARQFIQFAQLVQRRQDAGEQTDTRSK